MQSYYLTRLRLALVRFRSKLSMSALVDHIKSRCSVRTRFISGDERNYWFYAYQHDIWYKGRVIESYGDSFPLPSHNMNRSAIKRYVRRKLLVGAGWSIVLSTVLTWAILY